MQEFEDGEDNEDVIFEAAEEAAEEPETEDVEESGEVEIQDLSESQDEDDTEDAVEVEEDFTDGVALLAAAVRWQWEQRLQIRFRRGRER